MLKVFSNNAQRGNAAPQGHLQRKDQRRRIAIITAAAFALVLAIAWIDGGEEPIRTIAEPVAMPADGAVS